jgi:hypothetical protein
VNTSSVDRRQNSGVDAATLENRRAMESIGLTKLDKPHSIRIAAGKWSNAARLFFALWYLLGSFRHVWYGLTNNRIYEALDRTSIFEISRVLWSSAVMPHITFFALLLAVFEMTVGILILSKGKLAWTGLAMSVLFNLFLVQLGLGFPETPWSGRDFVLNRLSCLLFALLQLPLFWVRFDLSFPGFVRARTARDRAQTDAPSLKPKSSTAGIREDDDTVAKRGY